MCCCAAGKKAKSTHTFRRVNDDEEFVPEEPVTLPAVAVAQGRGAGAVPTVKGSAEAAADKRAEGKVVPKLPVEEGNASMESVETESVAGMRLLLRR